MRKQFIRRACTGLLAAVMVFAAALPPSSASYAADTPKDVKGHWAQKYIEKAIAAGIVNGYSNGEFRPENPVTRAEFCHMLNEALGNTATASVSFKDVAKDGWYYSDVSKAVAAGYTNGYDDGTFGPNRKITRQEAAIMLSLVVPTYGNSATLTGYPDYNNISTWARSAMSRMVSKGYINVYTNDKKLHPKDNMTRAQAATVIVNLLEKENIVKSPTNSLANGSSLSNTIYSNGVTVTKSSGSGKLELNKCVVLGTLSVNGGDTITLTNSRVSQATIQNNDENVSVVAKGETYVKNASVANTTALQTSSLSGDATYGSGFANVSIVKNAQVTLNGTFPKVSLDGSSSDVTLASGTVTALTAGSSAAGSAFTAESGTTVSQATAASAVSFYGTGKISKLTANASGITYETKPGTITLGANVTAPTKSDARTTIKVSPTNGKTEVKVDAIITLTFSSPMKLYSGSTISRSDIQDFVELRKNSSNGGKVEFTGTIDSDKKVITITPDEELDDDTKYYISIDKAELADANGNANNAFTSWFTTGDASGGSSSVSDYMIFTPKDGAKNVSTSVEPKIEFTEAMLCYDGTSVKDRDLEDIIIFREGSSGGANVKFEATISSDKETVTIVPDEKLDEDTKYYLAVDSKALKTASKGTVVPAASVTWTTGNGDDDVDASDYVSFSPKNNKKSIALDIQPQITFSEKMECYDGSEITNKDLQDIVILRLKSSSGKDVDFSASIDSAKKVITVTPEDDLKEETVYYLGIASKSIRTAKKGDKVPGVSVTWTTGDKKESSDYVSFYPRDGKKNVDRYEEPVITFSQRVEFYNGDSISSGRNRDVEDCITFEDEDGDDVEFKAYYDTSNYEITLKPTERLSSDTKYTITVRNKRFRTRSGEHTIPTSSVTWTTE
ncbi:S-layer homology domain-containing protein [Bacilliculturomica massiliensis]|uniref:S-layer homology domain-containing protein n=1 Tax=Bacilliculturomica massiliensis TaxID=1917867 RepID=UPI001030D9E9|nr:S-layer homology domain-containing protein [Bacilliculturomica massiliensis]